MPIQKIEFEYDIPEGYRFVRYGCPKRGEHYMEKGKVRTAKYDYDTEWPIVGKMVYCEEPAESSKRHKNADLIHAWAEGAIIQYKASDGTWADCLYNEPLWKSKACYRIKPAKRVIIYRNFLTKSGDIAAWPLLGGRSGYPVPTAGHSMAFEYKCKYTEFKRWIGDWQTVEVEVEE